jgi:putative ABC transport system permease protein
MIYSLQSMVHDRGRYLPGVLAVAFSAVLMALQCGLLIGLFQLTSIPLDFATANTDSDIWVGSQAVQSIDLGRPIPESHIGRLSGRPGVGIPETYIAAFAIFTKTGGGTDLCFLLGTSLTDVSGGAPAFLNSKLRDELSVKGGIVLDVSDLERMQMKEVGDKAKINGKEVTLVGTVTGIKSLAAPWIYCSVTTAKDLLGPLMPQDNVSYLIARCESPQRAHEVVKELNAEYSDMTAFTAEEFSLKSRLYWLLRTKAGVAIGFAALLGLLVGALVTMQTLYAATMASAREYATLLALGIPRWRVGLTVLVQSFWVGLFGILVAYPVVLGLAAAARQAGTQVVVRWEITAAAAVVTMATALSSGLVALRSVRQIEPLSLLR